MPRQERGEFIPENVDKVLSRPHSTKGPLIAFFDRGEISDNHASLESAVDSIARRLLTSQETSV